MLEQLLQQDAAAIHDDVATVVEDVVVFSLSDTVRYRWYLTGTHDIVEIIDTHEAELYRNSGDNDDQCEMFDQYEDSKFVDVDRDAVERAVCESCVYSITDPDTDSVVFVIQDTVFTQMKQTAQQVAHQFHCES